MSIQAVNVIDFDNNVGLFSNELKNGIQNNLSEIKDLKSLIFETQEKEEDKTELKPYEITSIQNEIDSYQKRLLIIVENEKRIKRWIDIIKKIQDTDFDELESYEMLERIAETNFKEDMSKLRTKVGNDITKTIAAWKNYEKNYKNSKNKKDVLDHLNFYKEKLTNEKKLFYVIIVVPQLRDKIFQLLKELKTIPNTKQNIYKRNQILNTIKSYRHQLDGYKNNLENEMKQNNTKFVPIT